eukprot:3519374-Pleurochrysis_carterae.AAC.1
MGRVGKRKQSQTDRTAAACERGRATPERAPLHALALPRAIIRKPRLLQPNTLAPGKTRTRS